MIDLILMIFMICVFVAGFWCGKTFGTAKKTWLGLVNYFTTLFD